MNSTLIA